MPHNLLKEEYEELMSDKTLLIIDPDEKIEQHRRRQRAALHVAMLGFHRLISVLWAVAVVEGIIIFFLLYILGRLHPTSAIQELLGI